MPCLHTPDLCTDVCVAFAGAAKILFSLPLVYFILAKYAVASVLTVVTKGNHLAPSSQCLRCMLNTLTAWCMFSM